MSLKKFHKKFNWHRFCRDALHFLESTLVFGIIWGILEALTWGVYTIFGIDFDARAVSIAWAVPLLVDELINIAYDWSNEVRDWDWID